MPRRSANKVEKCRSGDQIGRHGVLALNSCGSNMGELFASSAKLRMYTVTLVSYSNL